MQKIRAIYIGDVRFNHCPVFEFNTNSKEFIMLVDDNYSYSANIIIEDSEWIVFKLITDEKTSKEIDGHAEKIIKREFKEMLKAL